MEFDRSGSLLGDEDIRGEGQRLLPEISRVAQTLGQGYETVYASVNLPVDNEQTDQVLKVADEKKALDPKVLVVCGIGGSNLGAKAVHEAVNGLYHNERGDGIKVYFADTVGQDNVADIVSIADDALDGGGNVLVNVVTKSGATTETIANFEVFRKLLLNRHDGGDYGRYVAAATNRGSKLWDYSQREGIAVLEIPKNVGGRYSVFSPAGLFPLAMLGVDVKALCEGAASMILQCVNEDIMDNPAALSAAILYAQHKAGKAIHDTFVFSPELEGVGRWYRQLLAESTGKEWDRSGGRRVNAGLTPTVSVGSTDLHSMAQLTLGGPKDKVTTFVGVASSKAEVVVPGDTGLVRDIGGRRMGEVMDAILAGAKAAYDKAQLPYMEVSLPDRSERSIGEFLQFKMLEVIYLSCLFEVNPFDQPNVEVYKKETRRILSGG